MSYLKPMENVSRLALVSDQHGNDVAFRAALEDIERIGVEQIVCLGDALQAGPQPRETLDRMQASGCRTVLGNSDAFLLELPSDFPEPLSERQLEVREWTREQLGADGLELIAAFDMQVTVDLAGMKLVCFHGSPTDFDDVLVPEIAGASLEPYLEALPADLLAGGHTHRQWTRRIGESLFVNPGSIGVPSARTEFDERRLLPVHAEYGLVIVDDLGLSIEFRQVPYAYADLERAMKESGRPYGEQFLADYAGP